MTRRAGGGFLGWSLLTPLAGLAGARLTRREDHPYVVAGQALTPWGCVPAGLALAIGLGTRRRGLAAVSGALLASYATWSAPQFRASGRRSAEALGVDPGVGPRVRIFSANLRFGNVHMGGIAAEIRAADADVVLLQELSPGNLEDLGRSGVLADYPYSLVFPRRDPFGMAICSRLPLADEEVWWVVGRPMVRATVKLGDHALRVYCVHARGPFRGGAPAWRAQLATLAGAVGHETGPVVMAGDFNATSGHRGFRALLAAGLADAHAEAGRGCATTWPTNLRVLPTFTRIDHVLVSPGVRVVGIREGDGRGSDHRPVIADLVVAPDR